MQTARVESFAWQPGTAPISDRGRFPVSAGGLGCRPYEPAAWTAIDDAPPAPRRDARMRVKRLGSEGDLLGGRCLDGLQQRVIGQVRIPLCGLVTGVTQHLADGEQIDTAVDHERRRRVPQIMEAKTRQPGLPDRPLPAVLDGHEGEASFWIGHQPRTVLEARQLIDDRQRGRRERDVARLARLAGRDEPGPPLNVHILPPGLQQFTQASPG